MHPTRQRLALSLLCVAGLYAGGTSAAPTISGVFHQLDVRSANSVGIPVGAFQHFGATSVVDDNGVSTTINGFASQDNATRTLFHQPQSVAPHFFSRVIPINPALDGAWTLTFFDADDNSSSAVTQDIFGATPMPFPTNVAITGGGNAPTFSWTLPTGVDVDAVRLQIWEPDSIINPQGQADIIRVIPLPGTANSFTVDPLQLTLVAGTRYSLEIGLLDLREPNLAPSNPNIVSRSRSFFDFILLDPGMTAQVFLPTVANDNGQPVYEFSVDVSADELIFIDPIVAIGYDYHIGATDPLIKSAVLPAGIGDGLYDIWLKNGNDWVQFMTNVQGGNTIDFGPNGIETFRVTGIEPGAGLDPEDTTAFITGLKFAESGRFTGTMTPLTLYVPDAAVPEPGMLWLIGIGAIGLGVLRGRRTAVSL